MQSEFDSFLFWRQPIAELDLDELFELGLTDSESTNESAEKAGLEEDQELQEFSAFHFWRAPLVSVDALIQDLELLL
ncbi:hypothetical protein WMY93_019142 [Mugilogobius chulae]|uniref:Protein AF1q n=1 Tax=Mugilogobius chulae TaxID=88201 RepID=A0AAW0NHL3_9GOBI